MDPALVKTILVKAVTKYRQDPSEEKLGKLKALLEKQHENLLLSLCDNFANIDAVHDFRKLLRELLPDKPELYPDPEKDIIQIFACINAERDKILDTIFAFELEEEEGKERIQKFNEVATKFGKANITSETVAQTVKEAITKKRETLFMKLTMKVYVKCNTETVTVGKEEPPFSLTTEFESLFFLNKFIIKIVDETDSLYHLDREEGKPLLFDINTSKCNVITMEGGLAMKTFLCHMADCFNTSPSLGIAEIFEIFSEMSAIFPSSIFYYNTLVLDEISPMRISLLRILKLSPEKDLSFQGQQYPFLTALFNVIEGILSPIRDLDDFDEEIRDRILYDNWIITTMLRVNGSLTNALFDFIWTQVLEDFENFPLTKTLMEEKYGNISLTRLIDRKDESWITNDSAVGSVGSVAVAKKRSSSTKKNKAKNKVAGSQKEEDDSVVETLAEELHTFLSEMAITDRATQLEMIRHLVDKGYVTSRDIKEYLYNDDDHDEWTTSAPLIFVNDDYKDPSYLHAKKTVRQIYNRRIEEIGSQNEELHNKLVNDVKLIMSTNWHTFFTVTLPLISAYCGSNTRIPHSQKGLIGGIPADLYILNCQAFSSSAGDHLSIHWGGITDATMGKLNVSGFFHIYLAVENLYCVFQWNSHNKLFTVKYVSNDSYIEVEHLDISAVNDIVSLLNSPGVWPYVNKSVAEVVKKVGGNKTKKQVKKVKTGNKSRKRVDCQTTKKRKINIRLV
uniref:Uncharacterized protein n=1 Tax=viral metagenome TaxID=1070528 RepID=A0A6C0I5J2_9ZZZZ